MPLDQLGLVGTGMVEEERDQEPEIRMTRTELVALVEGVIDRAVRTREGLQVCTGKQVASHQCLLPSYVRN